MAKQHVEVPRAFFPDVEDLRRRGSQRLQVVSRTDRLYRCPQRCRPVRLLTSNIQPRDPNRSRRGNEADFHASAPQPSALLPRRLPFQTPLRQSLQRMSGTFPLEPHAKSLKPIPSRGSRPTSSFLRSELLGL